MKVKKIQEKEKIKLQLKNKKKVQKLKEKGITLIALVVTIIILLILAGVTLNMAMSGDGLFSRARNVAEKYKKAQEDESQLISEIRKEMNSEYVGAYITGYTPTSGSCTITGEQSGIGAPQTFTTTAESELRWRIWDYDGTTLRIILDKPTTQTLQLKGVAGYNNGVYIINEICRQCFGQYEGDNDNKKMKEGISVANLRRSDIQKVSTYDYTKYKHKTKEWQEVVDNIEDENLIHYGEIKTYSENYQSPIMWSSHDSAWNYEYNKDTKKGLGEPSCENPWEQEFNSKAETGVGDTSETTKFKQSYYSHDYNENEFKSEEYYNIIFGKENETAIGIYFLAGRNVRVNDDYCKFGMNYVDTTGNKSNVSGNILFDSNR